ncbi:iron chelate uptake ABC transporter family permease subunit [Nocardia sp. NBC_01329]|uniref:iron chelate uptake ABC transporter family permease subunit n=1 Tax=Nocardia sp. NBC_01329 TaxID=2903594 RepID=UPI002E13FE2D|nr:iron chelate uptake ABC transporter family permease subunit [Nocardia sp. NBC_01329]
MRLRTDSTRQRTAWLVVLVALLAFVAVLSLMTGARPVAPDVVLHALLTPDPADPDHSVVWDGRIPRTALGLVAGVAMGVAGALVQGLTRNPLADPGLLGINAGAAFSVVLAVGVFRIETVMGYIWFAFAGAVVAAVAVLLIGRGRNFDPVRLILAGVALSAVLEGIGQGLALVNPQAFDRLRTWNVGSIAVGSLQPVTAISVFVLAGVVLGLFTGRRLNALAMGDEVAASLGTRARTTRIMAVLATTLLAGSVAATAGVIVFLGLMVPHLARRMCGPDYRWIVVYSAVLGAVILLMADILGRVIVPGELAAGIVVAFVGAPFLIALARRRKVIEL